VQSERRSFPRKSIRLRVAYKRAESLVTEYTRSISKGGCSIESKHPLPLGTRFVFEMYARGTPRPVEVEGQVVHVQQQGAGGTWVLGIEYLAPDDKRPALEAILERIFASHENDAKRLSPRIPVAASARDQEHRPYIVHDISMGGMGLRVPGFRKPPPEIGPGTPVNVAIEAQVGVPLMLKGEVVWTTEAKAGFAEAAIGIAFRKLADRERAALDEIVHLRRVPRQVTVAFLVEQVEI
jgi:c-di-GMP-binding flagellar brake protein YcgR